MKRNLIYILVVLLISLTGFSYLGNDTTSTIDITGNWKDENGFLPYIQTREPALEKEEVKRFTQELFLPKGTYTIRLEYEREFDKENGTALGNNFENFNGFKVNGVTNTLNFHLDSITKKIFLAERKINITETKEKIKLELAVHNTRVLRTWVTGNFMPNTNQKYFAVDPGTTKEYMLVHDIPFLLRKTDFRQTAPWFTKIDPSVNADRGSLKLWDNGMNFNLDGTKVSKLHFLGMIHQVDIANGSWYSAKGDEGYSHFIGDKAGDILITFQNNERVTIPLIFGFNLWYGRPWDMLWFYRRTRLEDGSNYDSTLFSGDPAPRELIKNTLCLVDGTRLIGSRSSNSRFIFSLDLENKPVKSIEVKGVPDMYSNPLISAITVETSEPSSNLSSLPDINKNTPAIKPVTIQYVVNEEYKPGIEKLQRAIYSFEDELPKLTEAEIPENYFGPQYNFKGTQEAIYAATYLYRNGPECGAKIADSGTGCPSSIAKRQTVHYTFGTGIWRDRPSLFDNLQNWIKLYQTKSPGNLPGLGQTWSRGIGELMREAMAFGYGKYINTYTDWLDSCLYSDGNPPHWIRIAGAGNDSILYRTQIRKVGSVIEKGNRENDGHGICMWGRYMAYHWLGHPLDWNKKRWDATKAAVDWIQWQLDTDTIFPGKRIDVLYTESECGMYEFYGSYNCLHGIELSIIMAKELGKTAEVEAWTKLYNRLQKGILDNLVDSSKFGPVWHTEPEHNWNDDGQKMVHIDLATEGITYTPLQDYAMADELTRKYLEIDINSYRYLMRDKNYNGLRMFGYGQGMMTQAALLLDEMDDAEKFVNMMVDHIYTPHLEGWTAPEGIMLHKSGKYWMPVCGYLGQDSHLADSQKALRLMLGIDDNNSDHLRLVPRFPLSWDQMGISDFPVLTGNKRQNIKYSYVRDEKGQVFKYGLENPVKNMSLRLGPIPVGKEIFNATLNGKKVAFEKLTSGDSRWVWINNLSGKQGEVKIQYQ